MNMNRLTSLFFMNNLKGNLFRCLLFFFLMFGSLFAQENKKQTIKKLEEYSDSSTQVLKKAYITSIERLDTLAAINTLQKLALIYSHKGNHKDSYDKLWQALLLADTLKFKDEKAFIYRDIGRHYSYYKRKKKALKFLNLSLNLRKDLNKDKEERKEELANAYLAFVATFRELNDFKSAKIYLDSSAAFLKNSTVLRDKAFFTFENAVILNSQGNSKEALKEFEVSLQWFSKELPAFEVLIYAYVGDCYKNLKEYKKSETYYLRDIMFIKTLLP